MLPVTLEWIGAKQFEATNIEDVKFRMDVKKKGGGAGIYASPTDHLLAAVGACSGIDVVGILDKMRQELTSLRIDVIGEQVEENPKYFRSIKITYLLTGTNLDRAKVEQAVTLSQDKYCSVRATLSDKCVITTEIVIS
ncbi:MAG: OsmC family protein [bacterium]|nr:OsmC family protein [bacterium]